MLNFENSLELESLHWIHRLIAVYLQQWTYIKLELLRRGLANFVYAWSTVKAILHLFAQLNLHHERITSSLHLFNAPTWVQYCSCTRQNTCVRVPKWTSALLQQYTDIQPRYTA